MSLRLVCGSGSGLSCFSDASILYPAHRLGKYRLAGCVVETEIVMPFLASHGNSTIISRTGLDERRRPPACAVVCNNCINMSWCIRHQSRHRPGSTVFLYWQPCMILWIFARYQLLCIIIQKASLIMGFGKTRVLLLILELGVCRQGCRFGDGRRLHASPMCLSHRLICVMRIMSLFM